MAHAGPAPRDSEEEDHLTDCGICLSEIEHPKALTCLHSFCLKCLKMVKHPPGVLNCPLCQEEIPIPSGGVEAFRDNFYLNQLKEWKAIRQMGDIRRSCASCRATDRDMIARCMECNGFICQQCADLHKTIAVLEIHTVFTIEELRSGRVDINKVMKDESCRKHKDQVLRWFCKTCGIPICRDCTVTDHRQPEHDYITLESATEGQITEIKELVASCKGISQQIEAAMTDAKKVKAELEESVKEVQKQLDDFKDEVKNAFLRALVENHKSSSEKLKQIETERCCTIENKMTTLDNLQSKLNNAMEVANQVVKSGSKYAVASNYSELSKTLSLLQDVEVCHVSSSISRVEFDPNRKSKIESVDLGSVNNARSMEGDPNSKSKIERVDLGSINASLMGGDGKWVLKKKIGKDGDNKVTNGMGVAIYPNNDLVVADYTSRNFKVFDSDGIFKRVLHQGNLVYPWDITLSLDVCHYATDQTGYVKVFNPNGDYLRRFAIKSPDGQLSSADGSYLYGLAIDSEGSLWIGSNKNYISKHNQDGTHISTIKIDINPWFIAVTPQKRIVVCSGCTNIPPHVLNHTGVLLYTIKAPKDAKQWSTCGVCCTGDDDVVYINSQGGLGQGDIYSFRLEADRATYLGCITTDVTYPRGMAYTEDNRLVVAQQNGYPVRVFTFERTGL